jgi:hypothetical protein
MSPRTYFGVTGSENLILKQVQDDLEITFEMYNMKRV